MNLFVVQFEYHTFLHHSQTIRHRGSGGKVFEYHTFLHHSQTMQPYHLPHSGLSTIHFYIILKPVMHPATAVCSLSTIHFYIILKRRCVCIVHERLFEYHTFLHHSQTGFGKVNSSAGLSTIHFYIILKPIVKATEGLRCLSTIHFYIILKHRKLH